MAIWKPRFQADRRATLLAFALTLLVGALLLGAFVGGTQAQSVRGLPEAKYTGGGPEACLGCHGGPQMTLMADTPHGDASNPHAPYGQEACESCHGPGSFHVSSARGGVGFPVLNDFHYIGWPQPGQFDSCVSCHADGPGDAPGIGWTGSLHDVSGLSCSSCHEVHALESPVADAAQQQSLCGTCHGRSNTSHAGFEANGILLEQMQCTTCHDVHRLAAGN